MLRNATFLFAFVFACSKPPAPDKAAPDAGAVPEKKAEPAVAEAKPAAQPVHWAGTYKTTRGTFYVPAGPEYSGVKWRGDDGPEGLGDGKIELTVDPQTGKVDGTLEGVLGPSVVYGSLAGETLAATIARKDIADRGFSGTLYGKVTAADATGTMKLSLPDAHLVRDGQFTLKRKEH
ncbi:hypothetical protein LVJ94_47180 [Pendulispora rubella]|uniref:Uncharacterized protein n=1 Tax=Pendulispora rubella TaxID=2741070 RepID=A0ABZ2L0K8_9BACT